MQPWTGWLARLSMNWWFRTFGGQGLPWTWWIKYLPRPGDRPQYTRKWRKEACHSFSVLLCEICRWQIYERVLCKSTPSSLLNSILLVGVTLVRMGAADLHRPNFLQTKALPRPCQCPLRRYEQIIHIVRFSAWLGATEFKKMVILHCNEGKWTAQCWFFQCRPVAYLQWERWRTRRGWIRCRVPRVLNGRLHLLRQEFALSNLPQRFQPSLCVRVCLGICIMCSYQNCPLASQPLVSSQELCRHGAKILGYSMRVALYRLPSIQKSGA